jgi:very-short-patch-repair endonuclease
MQEGAVKAAEKLKGRVAWNKGIYGRSYPRKAFTETEITAFKRNRRGNGTGMMPAESALAPHLPEGFVYNYAIPTKTPKGNGYPTCYKVDFGHPIWKTAIEVDGVSHNSPSRRAQDKKKDAKLLELGWFVLRISNQEVLSGSGISKLLAHITTSPTEW